MTHLANTPSVHRISMEGVPASLGLGLGSGSRLQSISVGIAESKGPQKLMLFL